MPQIGPAEILVILLVGLLVFGPKKLPEIGRQVGRGLHELRKFQDTVKGELDGVLHYDEHESPPAVNGAASNGANGSAAMTAADAPPALPPVEADTPTPAPKAGSRPPSRFRAPGSQPTT